MSPLALTLRAPELLAWWLAIGWQLVCLGLVVYAIDRALPRGRAIRVRRALWALLLVRLVLPPDLLAAEPLPTATLARLPAAATAVPTEAGWPLALLALWALGALALLLRGGLRVRQARRLVAASHPGDERWVSACQMTAQRLGLRRPAPVRLVAGLSGPLLIGILRPRVLVPTTLAPASLDAHHALLHELCHQRRRDLVAQLIWDTAALLFWWHPLLWLGRARARTLREAACDLDVAHVLGPEAASYRKSLIRAAAARLLPAPPMASAAGWRPFGAAALERIEALAHAPRSPRRARWTAATAFVFGGLLLLPLATRGGEVLDEHAPLPRTAAVREAQALLERTFTERDTYGCLHRQAAFFQLMRATETAEPPAGSAAR